MSWTTGYRQAATLPTGPSLADQARAEMLAANKSTTHRVTIRCTDPVDPGYQRPTLARRRDTILAEIANIERTQPRNRKERRTKAAILRDLWQEIQRPGSQAYHQDA